MKQTLLVLALSLLTLQCSQAQTNNLSYISHKKDTLILPKNTLGKVIASIWDTIPNSKKPTIIIADELLIKQKNDALLASRKKKPFNQ